MFRELLNRFPVFSSFALVVAAYVVYAVVAVPIIVPTATNQGDILMAAGSGWEAKDRLRVYNQRIKYLFDENSWQRGAPKILERGNIRLLFNEHDRKDDGRVFVKPLTVIVEPTNFTGTPEQWASKCTTIDVPEGALIRFDRPLGTSGANVGQFQDGYLYGEVTIHSRGESSGPEDDFFLKTSDVVIGQTLIRTEKPVAFRYGRSEGNGKGMVIRLVADTQQAPGTDDSFGISTGIETLEITKIDKIKFFPTKKDNQGKQSVASKDRENKKKLFDVNAPVVLRCSGPFCYEAKRRKAYFDSNVEMVWENNSPEKDYFNCDNLSIFFAAVKPATRSKGNQALGNLDPEKIAAFGEELVAHIPTQGFFANGQKLQYDVLIQKILLTGKQDTTYFKKYDKEIYAQQIEYILDKNGGIGLAHIPVPGKIIASQLGGSDTSQGSKDEADQFVATWKHNLTIKAAHEKRKCLSLSGEATVTSRRTGEVFADKIHFWFFDTKNEGVKKKAPAGKENATIPDRILAEGNVKVNSPQLVAEVKKLQCWFVAEETKPQPAGVTSTKKSPTVTPVTTSAAAPTPTTNLAASSPPRKKSSSEELQFDVRAESLHFTSLLLPSGATELGKMRVEGNVRINEIVRAMPNQPVQPPLHLTGDKVSASNISQPSSIISVQGTDQKYAVIGGRGMQLEGPQITLDRGANTVNVVGPGRMTTLVEKDFSSGKAYKEPQNLVATWQKQLLFNGLVVQLDQGVQVQAPNATLVADWLELHLDKRIDFASEKFDKKITLKKTYCLGGVDMLRQTLAEPVEQAVVESRERMQTRDLTVELDTGEVFANGPGIVTSTRLDQKKKQQAQPAGQPPEQPANQPAEPALFGTTVRFDNCLLGNIKKETVTLQYGVRAAFAPVTKWDTILSTDEPEKLGPDGAILSCEQLRLTSEPLQVRNAPRTVAFEADGNAVVEGALFTAKAPKISYSQSKDRLYLQSEGRAFAELYRQDRVGANPDKVVARDIQFWVKKNHFKVDQVINVGAQGAGVEQSWK